jgi:hypothetical protein
MRTDTRRRMLHDIAAISRIVSERATGRWGPRAHFTMHRELAVGRVRVGLTVGIHVAPPAAGYPAYRAIVGLHPSIRRPAKGGWHSTLLRLDWYGQCEELLARYGYRGDWYSTPYGRVGDFERRVTTRKALLAELGALERLYSETWPLTR